MATVGVKGFIWMFTSQWLAGS